MKQQTKRLEWLDAMRGFTMILVVACHVSNISYDLAARTSSTQELLTLFRMPLFFFVSGFLAYKASAVWTGRFFADSLLKKVRVQIVPTVVFLFACIMYKYKDFWPHLLGALQNSCKGGYWFTWVLLQMFLVYYVFAFIEQKVLRLTSKESDSQDVVLSGFCKSFRLPSWLPIALLWLCSALLYESAYLPKMFKYPTQTWALWSSFNMFAKYFMYFVTGNIVRRYWTRMERLFDSRWFFPAVVITAYFCCIEVLKWHTLKFEWRNLPLTVAIFALLAIIIMFFRRYEHSFSKETRLGRTMQYIGTRTLDIYLIHYFFIPKLPMVGPFLKAYRPNVVPELVLTIGMALIIVAFCCLTSSVLRTSPLLTKYLFGREKC